MTELLFCPLECGARIASIEKHLLKCKNRSKLGTFYLFCPYNSHHIIKYKEYGVHVDNCDCNPNQCSSDNDDDKDLDEKFDREEEEEGKGKKENVMKGVKKGKMKERVKTTYDKIEDVDEDSKMFYKKVYIDVD